MCHLTDILRANAFLSFDNYFKTNKWSIFFGVSDVTFWFDTALQYVNLVYLQ